MSVREYIGARYVPIFADPVEWNNTRTYEPLTIVQYQGNSYTSKQYVPAGVDISNETYWILTGNYNAQIEQYRSEVNTLDSQMAGTASSGLKTLITNNTNRISTIEQQLDTKTHFGVIGDSFSDQSGEWPTILGNMIHLTPVVKAVGGTGFVSGSTPFITQLSNLQNDAHWDDLAFIIVYGGTNDFAGANASVSQMKTAFNAFKNAYNAITNAPPMIFAFCNLGNSNRTHYNYIGPWYNELVRYLRSENMPGFVDNVIYWLFPFDSSEVFGSDTLHPTTLGHKIIASYFAQIINGTYSGVRGYEIVRDANNTQYTIITFENGMWTVETKCNHTPITAHNSYVNLGFATHCYVFGTTAPTDSPQMVRNMIGISANLADDQLEAWYLAFNPLTKGVYVNLTGSERTTELTATGVVNGCSL